uniref:Eco57I restriction-modification methylase domain-containing protein n=1 Tax=Faucicola boevrei TaxID=346665 RepID=UPI0037363EF2
SLHLSGTPFKALSDGKFAQDEIYNWSYVDEQSAKLNWSNEDSNPYKTLPTLNLFSYQMSAMISDKVNKGADIEGQNLDFAFDLNEFFATNDKGKFEHEKEVKKWLDTLSKNEKYPFSTKALRDELKHTFWLLEYVDSAKALARLLNNHPVFENYHIILAVGDGRFDNETVNQNALQRVKEAIKNKNHDKTITLSVGQLTTGVTIPEWTAVLMLSNVKSPAQYWQTAFRAQNPWVYPQGGQVLQKKNAYVFDFAPERTLIIYDEFANNLLSNTSNGGGTENQRKDNIKQLLNFFPVIAEDSEGKMVELDVNQVLTIPKLFKANQVVRQGFMSNFLFANIDRVFGNISDEIKNVLDKLSQLKVPEIGSITTIDTDGIELNDNGDVVVSQETIINTNNAKFGQKIYGEITKNTDKIIDDSSNTDSNLPKNIVQSVISHSESKIKELANEYNLSEKFAEKVLKEQSQIINNQIEKLQSNVQIKYNELENKVQNELKVVQNDNEKQQILASYEQQKTQIEQAFKTALNETVKEQVEQFTQNSTESILQRAKEKDKEKQENNTGKTLNKFSRTIPMFLMAYGDKNITLANFDDYVDDKVFEEVTTISLAQFRLLRDEGQFFDEQVFDTSVQEFLNKRFDLANYFEHQKEDIFDYIPPQKTNQIFTPKWVVKMMIDKFEQENPDIFNDPNLKFADLYMKSGLYMTEIVKRLYIGLENQFPNPTERLKHIFANQIYGFAPSEIIYQIAKNFILGFDDNQYIKHNIVMLDTTPYAESLYKGGDLDFNKKLTDIFGKSMKFDVIVGNPPYQDETETNNRKTPVYPYFYDLAKQHSNRYCLISPARFLFNAGLTSKEWNEKILQDRHISVLYYEDDPKKVFPSADIKGGIAIIYRNINKNFGEIGQFIKSDEIRNLYNRIKKYEFTPFSSIMIGGRSDFLLNENFHQKYPNAKKDLLIAIQKKAKEKGGKIPIELAPNSDNEIVTSTLDVLSYAFPNQKPNDGNDYYEVVGVINNKRVSTWINRDYLTTRRPQNNNIDFYKVFVPKSMASGKFGEILSEPLIGMKGTTCTPTFLRIGMFGNEYEATNCTKYIKTKFARALLGIRKITQDNPVPVWENIPLQDFTNNSDIDWTKSIAEIDKQLYAKYGLSDDEIAFIESKVKAME